MSKHKKPLGEYKWVQDAIDSILAEPEADRERRILEFMAKKVREDGNRQD